MLKALVRNKKRWFLFILIIYVISMVGCQKKEKLIDYSIYPDVFKSEIEKADQMHQQANRLIELETDTIYRCYKEDQNYYFITSTYGYEEDMLIGVSVSSTRIEKISILYENESEDYGEYVIESWFLDRFIMPTPTNIKLVKRKKSHENEVIAITGATITSQAVVDGVNKCIEKVEDLK